MPHPFILVLHFPPQSPLTSADIEDEIAEAIGNPLDDQNADHIVDGNEIGDAIDIFVFTRDPTVALELCKPMLKEAGLLDTMIAATRKVDEEEFDVLHPSTYQGEFQL
jgi:hypothetical protein